MKMSVLCLYRRISLTARLIWFYFTVKLVLLYKSNMIWFSLAGLLQFWGPPPSKEKSPQEKNTPLKFYLGFRQS